MKTYFVNVAIDKGINEYLISKDKPEGILYNSFLVVVIRILVSIYGELDIINPYELNDEPSLIKNMTKFGYTIDNIQEFFRLVDGFYKTEDKNGVSVNKEENVYFIDVQKKLIDMFNIKRTSFGCTEKERNEFFDLLYTPGCSNFLRLSYNFKTASNIYEIAEYYKNAMNNGETKQVDVKEEEKNLLGFDVYKLFGFNINDISKMSSREVDELNSEIYDSFDIKESTINKDYLLKTKIEELMMQNRKITTGNGYVDILLVLSIIVTTLMSIMVFGVFVF